MLLGAFLKPRALRAAVAGRAGLLAPPPPRTRPLLPLARAAGLPLGQPRTRRAKLRQLAFEALDPPPRHPHPLAEPRLLPRQRSDRRPLPPRPAQGLAQLPPQRRDDRVRLDAVLVKVPHLGRAGIERLLQRPTLLAKPRHLHPQRHHRAALPRVHAGLPKQTVQTLRLALQRQGVPRRPAGLPRLRDDLPQPPARRLPPPLPRSRVAPRPHLRPPQLLGARLRRLRPLPLPLVQRPPVRRLLRLGTGHRPKLLRPPGQRHARMSVCVPYRHALDDTTFRMALPVPPQNNPHDRSSTAWPNSYRVLPSAPLPEGEAARHPLPAGGADGRQRQLRILPRQEATDPAGGRTGATTCGPRCGSTSMRTARWLSSTAPGGWRATTPTGGCWTGPGRRHEPFRSPPRLAPLASAGCGTEKRTFHVLRKPDILFAPDTLGLPVPAKGAALAPAPLNQAVPQ